MIVIADPHFGRENDSITTDAGPSQIVDLLKRLDYVLAQTIMLKQTAIAVAGDVFNKLNPKAVTISAWFTWLNKCRKAGITVYVIPGNHDAGVDWMNAVMLANADLPNVVVCVDPEEIQIDDGRNIGHVLFWPHIPLSRREMIEAHGSVSEFVASAFPDAEVIITHGQVSTSDYMNDIFFEAGDAMEIDQRPFKKLKRIVAGHIHAFGKYGKVVYPGSMTINNFGELDEKKGFIDLDISTGAFEWHQYPDNDVTPWIHVELDFIDKDETSLDESAVAEAVQGAVIKLTAHVKRHGVMNEAYVRALFNKYGKVTRFETKVTDGIEEIVQRKRASHKDLLKSFLKDHATASDDTKKTALKIGSEIIEEVAS